MTDNPYQVPSAEVRDITQGTIRVYSPTQVACGTIGGPVGLIYFLKANFDALGNKSAARKTVLLGIILIIALVLIVPQLPNDSSSIPTTIAYIAIARFVATRYQLTKAAIELSDVYEFHSNWRVLGHALLCLLASAVAIMGPLFVLAYLGVVGPFAGA